MPLKVPSATPLRHGYHSQLKARAQVPVTEEFEASFGSSYQFDARLTVRVWTRNTFGTSNGSTNTLQGTATASSVLFAKEGLQTLLAAWMHTNALSGSSNWLIAAVNPDTFSGFSEEDTFSNHPGWETCGAKDNDEFYYFRGLTGGTSTLSDLQTIFNTSSEATAEDWPGDGTTRKYEEIITSGDTVTLKCWLRGNGVAYSRDPQKSCAGFVVFSPSTSFNSSPQVFCMFTVDIPVVASTVGDGQQFLDGDIEIDITLVNT